MAKPCYYFYGVTVGADRRVGYITSSDLVKHFNATWLPGYQRERVLRESKIQELVSIFKSGAPIDAIKLNLIGSLQQDKAEALLEGDFHVIDGQQRLWALQESGVLDYKMPIELYLNLPIEEEVRLFHQFNDDGTDLSFGDLARSYQGPMADMFRKLVKSRTFPMKLAYNSSKLGMTPSTFVPVMGYVYAKIVDKQIFLHTWVGKRLKSFLQSPYESHEVDKTEFATLNVVKEFIRLFGTYDSRAIAYKRSWYLAWSHFVVNNFLLDNGRIAYGTRDTKMDKVPLLLQNARVRELLSQGGHTAECALYNIIADHVNFKIKGDRIPYLQDAITHKASLTKREQRENLRQESESTLHQ